MLKSLLALFEDSRTQQKPAYTLELATAALFCEVINADYEVTKLYRIDKKVFQQLSKKLPKSHARPRTPSPLSEPTHISSSNPSRPLTASRIAPFPPSPKLL